MATKFYGRHFRRLVHFIDYLNSYSIDVQGESKGYFNVSDVVFLWYDKDACLWIAVIKGDDTKAPPLPKGFTDNSEKANDN